MGGLRDFSEPGLVVGNAPIGQRACRAVADNDIHKQHCMKKKFLF